jgi:hypothetical protein
MQQLPSSFSPLWSTHPQPTLLPVSFFHTAGGSHSWIWSHHRCGLRFFSECHHLLPFSSIEWCLTSYTPSHAAGAIAEHYCSPEPHRRHEVLPRHRSSAASRHVASQVSSRPSYHAQRVPYSSEVSDMKTASRMRRRWGHGSRATAGGRSAVTALGACSARRIAWAGQASTLPWARPRSRSTRPNHHRRPQGCTHYLLFTNFQFPYSFIYSRN